LPLGYRALAQGSRSCRLRLGAAAVGQSCGGNVDYVCITDIYSGELEVEQDEWIRQSNPSKRNFTVALSTIYTLRGENDITSHQRHERVQMEGKCFTSYKTRQPKTEEA